MRKACHLLPPAVIVRGSSNIYRALRMGRAYMINRRYVLSGLLAFCLPLTAAAQDINTAPSALADGWVVAKPTEVGLDPQALAELVEKVDTGWIPNVHALLIEHQGRLVFERYWPGEDDSVAGPLGYVDHGPATLHDIRSITKSVTSLLLGIALGGSGEDALARPIPTFSPKGRTSRAGLTR